MKKILTLLFAMVTSINFIHADFVQSVIGPTQTITYHFYTESHTAEVVGYEMVTGSAVIPEQILWADIYYTVTGIGEDAFWNCTDLTSIAMPDLLERIGDFAFGGCINLTNITFPFNRLQSIGKGAFSNCIRLTSLTIPNSVTSIGEGAFWNCSSLTSLTIPNSFTSIEKSAFYECSGLTSVTIPNSVKSIGGSAFSGCSGLTSVTIPNSVKSIGEDAFDGCNSLTRVDINDLAAWCAISFGSSTANPLWYAHNLYVNEELVTDLVIPNGVTSIGNYAFQDCTSLTSVTIPNSVISIGEYAFIRCSGLTSAAIGNSVTSIGKNAFRNCSSLTSVTIPNSVTSIGDSAFRNCSSLTSIEIPNSVTSIGDYVFYGCTGLTSIEIPNSVTSIGMRAFMECTNLDSLVFESENPATLGVGGFDYTNNCPIVVPCSAVDTYKTAWSEYANRITCSGTQGTTVTIPTVQDLATAGYDVANKVVLCLYFTDDATVCNDIYAVGTFNNWAKGEGNTEDFANCSKFEPLAGFEGWYAVEFPYSDNVQGKPVQAKSNGAFSWEYQSGDAEAWTNKGGAGSQTATIWAGYNNEADVYYPAPGCYIYELAYWKSHNNPCVIIPTHNYTIHLYAPDACEEMKPAIIGNFNNWTTGVAMSETTDEQGKKMYTITIADEEGKAFKFRDAAYDNWSNELQEYLSDVKVWATFSNFVLPAVTADTTIVFDFSDNSKYRFKLCEKVEDVVVWLKVPTGAPGYYNGAIEMVVYSADEPTAMPLQYNQEDELWSVELQAKGSNYFFVREANSEGNYILNYTHYYYSDGSDEYVWSTWGTTFQYYWEDGTGDFTGSKIIMLDISNPSYYKWDVPAIGTGIEDVLSDQVQCTKVIRNGQIFILRGDKTYTLQGQEVK